LHSHILCRLIAVELDHLQLIEREKRHAAGEAPRLGIKLIRRNDFMDEADLLRFRSRYLVAGQEISLRVFEADAVDPIGVVGTPQMRDVG
jgi:hypothetical protein